MSTPLAPDSAPLPPPPPVIPSFDGPLNFAAHQTALRAYFTWLLDAIVNQHPEEGYTIQHAVVEALQLDEMTSMLTPLVDKEIKDARNDYQGQFGQYLFDSQLENARIALPRGDSRMIYTRTTTSYTVDDPMALRGFLIQNPTNIDLLQMRMSTSAVEGFLAANNGMRPPGVGVFTNTKALLKK